MLLGEAATRSGESGEKLKTRGLVTVAVKRFQLITRFFEDLVLRSLGAAGWQLSPGIPQIAATLMTRDSLIRRRSSEGKGVH